jgi:hypothetical protein
MSALMEVLLEDTRAIEAREAFSLADPFGELSRRLAARPARQIEVEALHTAVMALRAKISSCNAVAGAAW